MNTMGAHIGGFASRTLIFDGDCGFCTSTANFIAKHSTAAIEIHPWQRIDVVSFGLTETQTAARVYFMDAGKAFGGHAALAKVLLVQRNWLLKIAGAIMLTPPFSWLAHLGYLLVAKYRHKLPGGTPACKL
jgi:predicted DCC family thiol-disulfide oxidoreductase YuxK